MMNKKTKKLRLVINTNVSKAMAFDVINANITKQFPQLRLYINNLGRMLPMEMQLGSEDENMDFGRGAVRDRKKGSLPELKVPQQGMAVRADIKFRAKGEKNSDIIIELTGRSLPHEGASAFEMWVLRSILWRLFNVTFRGLAR